MKLQNKTILITGASSGIGKATAIRCARDGAHIILTARNTEKLAEVKQLVEQAGGTAEVIITDVTKSDEVRNLFLQSTKDGRRVDVVFSNAGFGYIANIQDTTVAEIAEVVNVNMLGMMYVAKFAAEVMTRQKSGHIIFTSSLGGLITLPQWSVYVGCKWGITAFADSIRMELARYNVRVTTVHPGAVKTDFFKKAHSQSTMNELGIISPETVAEKVYAAMLTNKKRVLVPFTNHVLEFGYKYFTSVAQFFIARAMGDNGKQKKPTEDEPEFNQIGSTTTEAEK